MKRALCLALLLSAACSSGPDPGSTLDLFNRLEVEFRKYNGALDRGDILGQTKIAYDIGILVKPRVAEVVEGLLLGDVYQQTYAAFGLGFSKDPKAVVPLREASESEDVGVRINAIAALGMLGLPEVPVEPFRERLKDPAWEVRLAALYGLRQMLPRGDDRGLLEDVLALLKDGSQDVRNEALILLRKIRKPESIEAILDGPISAEESLVRSNAALTLATFGTPARKATPYLIEMLLDTDSKVVESAWLALKEVNDKDFDRSYASWKDWYDDEQSHHYSCALHREVDEEKPGTCRVCKGTLERFTKDLRRKPVAVARRYACPDHPEVVTSAPASCGKEGCGKKLEEKKPESRVYVCPDHPEVLTTSPVTCGKTGCGKALIPKR